MKKRRALGVALLFSILTTHSMQKTKDLVKATGYTLAGIGNFALGTTKAALGGCIAKNPEMFVGEEAGQAMKELCLERAAVGFLNMETVENFKKGKKCFVNAGKKLTDACKEKKKEKKD